MVSYRMVLDPRVEKLHVCVKRRLASFNTSLSKFLWGIRPLSINFSWSVSLSAPLSLSCPVHFHYHDHEYGHGLGHDINMDRDWDRDRERDRSTDRGTNSDTDPLSVKNSSKFRSSLARCQITLNKFLRGIRLL
jgi:hypothetical protein